MNRKWIAGAGIGVLMTLSVACGGGGPAGQPAANSDETSAEAPAKQAKARELGNACDLVTTASLSEIMGEPMKDGAWGGAPSNGKVRIDQCTWLAATPKSDAVASVFYRKSTEKDAKAVFERTRGSFPDAVAVDGFGAGAYYVPSSGQLNVLNGDTWFIFTASHMGLENPDQLTEEHRKLAETVVNG